ncbi:MULTISPECIES: TetR/AcrR family transcriptional regulator [Streptomyces]|uniref:TetR/AcrR family transcriptional regulator n=1 Tax=Streptomyces TaxID=1883 RepID=UPI0022494E7D|nr:TetR/AcrR family transcriptional regulator [Streptomyces sp. JHD 1]MCX2968891.1 TetR/AcrR family transcriptional regulator [Streptomyces sp. JHD 1]
MPRPASPPPGTTARTRRAILDAALAVLTEDRTASLSEIARAAEVGRSTLHRYFPDRAALVSALFEDASQATARTIEEAALDRGTPAEALRRLVPALFELGPRVNFLFNETQVTDATWDTEAWEKAHWPVGALYERGRAQGYFDTGIDVDWFIRCLWYLTSAGWEAMGEGVLAKHEAVARVTRTLERGVLLRGE